MVFSAVQNIRNNNFYSIPLSGVLKMKSNNTSLSTHGGLVVK